MWDSHVLRVQEAQGLRRGAAAAGSHGCACCSHRAGAAKSWQEKGGDDVLLRARLFKTR